MRDATISSRIDVRLPGPVAPMVAARRSAGSCCLRRLTVWPNLPRRLLSRGGLRACGPGLGGTGTGSVHTLAEVDR